MIQRKNRKGPASDGAVVLAHAQIRAGAYSVSTQFTPPLRKVRSFPKKVTLSPLLRSNSTDSVNRGSRLRRKSASVSTFSNAAPARSTKTSNAGPEKRSTVLLDSTIAPEPEINNLLPIPENDTLTSASLVFQLFKSLKPSLSGDECIFLLTSLRGIRQAVFLAATHRWKVRQPLRGLLAMMSESGKNYSARSVKRKRLSGSPVASRKRSSGA
jgi:hypothetical protein